MTNTFPGVYELVEKKKGFNALISLGHQYITNSTPGTTLKVGEKSYKIINRSGLSPTGQLILKEL